MEQNNSGELQNKKNMNLCRICLQDPQDAISINNLLEGCNTTYSDAFLKITGFVILEHEPQQVCLSCGELVRLAYELRKKAEVTQALLGDTLVKVEEIKQEIEINDVIPEPNIDDKVESDDDKPPLTTKKKEKPFQCQFCVKSYLTQAGLNSHVKKKHPKEQPFECNYCHKRFLFEFKREAHRRVCKEGPQINEKREHKRYICPVCGKLALKDHIKSHMNSESTAKSDTQKYICDLCGMTTPSRASIGNHMRFNHLNFIVKCKYCPATFNNPSLLTFHVRKHHKATPHVRKCRDCDFTSAKDSEMRRHRLCHSEKKPFKCNVCHAEFKFNFQFVLHMATHSDVRAYVCQVCGSAFKTYKTLSAHKKVHQERDYECPVCYREYSTNQLMRTHVEKHHPEYELPPPGTVLSKSWRKKEAEKEMNQKMYQKIKEDVS